MKKVLGIDGTWLFFKLFFANNKCVVGDPNLPQPEQDFNLLMVSFLQVISKLVKNTKYEYRVYCLFDQGTWYYRPKDKFTEYKSNREKDPLMDDLWPQLDRLVDLLRDIGVHVIRIPGLEADDLGMYYSHNSDDCILYTTDYDWRQSITHTTRILKNDTYITLSDVINDYIETPFDLAISKAINSEGHDNVSTIDIPVEYINGIDASCKLGKCVKAYKLGLLPDDIKEKIDYNLQLTRLDRILGNKELQLAIEQQESLTTAPNTNLALTMIFNKHKLENYPPYLFGTIGKYIRVFSG